jgi:hypothetical protein
MSADTVTSYTCDPQDPAAVAEWWLWACVEGRIDDAWRDTSTAGRLQLAGVYGVEEGRVATRRGVLRSFDLADQGHGHRWWPEFRRWLTARYSALNLPGAHEALRFDADDSDMPDGWSRVTVAATGATGTFPLLLEHTGAGWRVGSVDGRPFDAAKLRRTRMAYMERRAVAGR